MNDVQLRRWQEAAQADYLSKDKQDYLLVAVPGAGKTLWALHTARVLLRAGKIKKILILCPTDHVKEQWARAAHQLGIDISHDYRNSDGSWPKDFDGVVITYAQMDRAPDLHEANVLRFPTLVIFDEVHHLQDEGSWGTKAENAFDKVTKRIHLSGTPWNKSGYIPWVTYLPDGTVKPDWVYSYYESLVDEVNCDVFFPEYGGIQEWFDGKYRRVDSSELMSPKDRSRWLNTCLAVPESNYILDTFTEADKELSRLRDQGQLHAGGLIIAKDQAHADKIADLLYIKKGQRIMVIASDKPGAVDDLREFAKPKNSTRWCIAIRMISEGVDIPRLRILIYATNYTTRLFFRQAVGRVIRGPQPPAKVYLPEDSLLIQYAKEFRDERFDALQKVLKNPTGERDGNEFSTFLPLRGNVSINGVVHANEIVSQDEIDSARHEYLSVGHGKPTTEDLTLLAKILRNHSGVPSLASVPQTAQPLLSEQKDALKSAMKKVVAQFCSITGKEYAFVNAELNRLIGVRNVREADLAQLDKRFEIVKGWLQEVLDKQ